MKIKYYLHIITLSVLLRMKINHVRLNKFRKRWAKKVDRKVNERAMKILYGNMGNHRARAPTRWYLFSLTSFPPPFGISSRG